METRIYTSTIEESTIVERVARIVSSVRGTKPDYTRLAAELEQAIPFDVFGVVLLRHDRQAVRVTVCHREAGIWAVFQHQHPCEGSKLELVLRTPTLMIHDYPNGLDGPPATSGDALSGYHQLHSTLIAPLIVEGRVLGTLELGSKVSQAYADKTLQRLISAVVRVLAAAIESAQIDGSAQIQDRQRQALKDVSSALTSKMDLSTILNQIVVGIASALNVASAVILIDRRKRRLCLEAQSRLDPVALDLIFGQNVRISAQSIIGWTLHRRQPYVSYDIATDERFPESRQFASELGMHSIFSYPLVSDSTIYGALLLFSPEPGGFTPLKADILSLFASQATVAIHNGLLLESAHQRSRFQEAIEQLERAHQQTMSGSLDLTMPAEGSANGTKENMQSDEQELLAHVREETQHTFGVSFTSLLRFLSEHLLVRGERDLQALLYADQGEQALDPRGFLLENALDSSASCENALPSMAEFHLQGSKDPLADTLSLLTQTAEAGIGTCEYAG